MALSDDTGILVLLVYWTWRCDLQGRFVIDMDKLDDIYCPRSQYHMHRHCSQLFGAHASTDCDTVSYPVGKGKT